MPMPKVAILSDIHGNLPALKAVLRRVAKSGAQEIAFGGDIIGYGASPRECVDLVKSLGGHCVLGNHDALSKAVVDGGIESLPDGWASNPVWSGIVHAVRQLKIGDLEWLWNRPWFLRLKGAILAHASLTNPNAWHYIEDEETAAPTLAVLKEKGIEVGFFGHTHKFGVFPDLSADSVPEHLGSDRWLIPKGAVCAVTVGSVGQARDKDDERATWVTWDPEERIVELHRSCYPHLRAAREIMETGLPMESAMRLLPGVKPRQTKIEVDG